MLTPDDFFCSVSGAVAVCRNVDDKGNLSCEHLFDDMDDLRVRLRECELAALVE